MVMTAKGKHRKAKAHDVELAILYSPRMVVLRSAFP